MRIRLDIPNANGTTTPINLEHSRDIDGGKLWVSRSRIPIDGALVVDSLKTSDSQRSAHVENAHHEDMEEEHEYGITLEGIASSTSVDWHGTEMSEEALQMMADQFRNGVPYVPAHHKDEWDDVFGVTYEAEVVASAEGLPTMLRVKTQLYSDDSRASTLIKRLKSGMKIGQSIGGWFTEMDVITNEEDEVKQIIIRGVELDHLAVTRRPSNPDSYISRLYNDGSNAMRAARTKKPVQSTICPGNVRHVWKVVESEDAVHIVLGKSAENWEGVHPYTGDAESGAVEREATSFEDLPIADMDTSWDWNTEAQNEVLYDGRDEDDPDWDRYKMAHTWMDPDADPETKSAYKLPVARMIDGRLTVVFRGVVAAMAALYGARGGVDIPEADRQGVYNHLVRYYEKVDRDPPELRAANVQAGPMRATSFMDLPISDAEMSFVWNEQIEREILGDPEDFMTYQQAHLLYDQYNLNQKSSYKYPFANIQNGVLTVNMLAVQSYMDQLVTYDSSLEVPEDLTASVYEHLAQYYVKAGMEPPTIQPKETEMRSSDNVKVDTVDIPCSAMPEVTDAHRSATPAVQSQQHAEVSTMSDDTSAPTTEDRISRLESLLERTITAMSAQVASQTATETTPEPAPEAVEDQEVVALRNKIAEMEATIERMAATPRPVGRPHSTTINREVTAATGYGFMVRAAEKHMNEGSALVAVCRAQEARRNADISELPSRRSLEQDLRAILAAAMQDGVISDPDNHPTWS